MIRISPGNPPPPAGTGQSQLYGAVTVPRPEHCDERLQLKPVHVLAQVPHVFGGSDPPEPDESLSLVDVDVESEVLSELLSELLFESLCESEKLSDVESDSD